MNDTCDGIKPTSPN